MSPVRAGGERIQEECSSIRAGKAHRLSFWNTLTQTFRKQKEGQPGRIDPAKAVTMYHRSAAGIDQPLPSDVRTPATLKVSSLPPLFGLTGNEELTP